MLTYLKRFPIDVLKIDRSMVEGVNNDPNNLAIVSAIIDLAHGLGLMVVAEGVETADELEKLLSLDCDFGQGYYWHRPCSPEEATQLIQDSLRP